MAQNKQYYNIPRDVNDMFYRYKMPPIISKIEGRGNGIKTVIPNMSDVAKALDRPPTYTTKFFGCELGALVSCDIARDKYLVNGAHDVERLQKALDGFISRFVLCGSCRNPETDLVVSKDERINKVCKACGARSPVDLTHKLCAYIIKNPPKPKSKGKKHLKNGDAEKASENQEGDDELTKRIQEEAAQMDQRENGADDDWAESTSAEAVAERMKNLSVQPKLIAADEDDDGEDPIDGFANFITGNPDATDADIVAEAYSLGVKEYKVAVVLMQVLFDENILKQLPSRAGLLATFAKNEKSQRGLIGGMERLIMQNKKELLKKTPLILKEMYDRDLIEEEVVLKWGEKASGKYVDKATSREIHAEAEPFLEWLKNAEEETDEDEDEE